MDKKIEKVQGLSNAEFGIRIAELDREGSGPFELGIRIAECGIKGQGQKKREVLGSRFRVQRFKG